MTQKFEGIRYDFRVDLTHCEGDESCFEILSLYKRQNRKSPIGNLNFILSELVQPVLNPDESDEWECPENSWVDASKSECEKLFANAVEAFEDKEFIKMLEAELDEDRSLGGWNAECEF